MKAYFVSYKRHDDDVVCSTNIVHADDESAVAVEFAGCSWFLSREAKEHEVEAAKAKGMPERWL